jgi:flagellar hook assembly protein FlgD
VERSDDTRAGAWLLIALLVVSIAAFGVTRALRSVDDIVNTVVLTPSVEVGEPAEVSFNTTIDEPDATVLIVDADEQRVRALQEGEPLADGAHEFTWDGRTDAGETAPAGQYGIRVILGTEGRDIVPPGSIIVTDNWDLEWEGKPSKSPGEEGG